MKQLLFSILILHSSLAISSELVEVYDCKSGREYIASYRYFSEQKELAVSDERKRDLSYQISSGCTHAAWRFINVFELLYHAQTKRHRHQEKDENTILLYLVHY